MNKEQYLKVIAEEKEIQNESNKRMSEAREKYLKTCTPFEKETEVKITFNSGRVAHGKVNSYAIWKDKSVFLNSYKDLNDNDKIKYISVPPQKVEKL